MLCLLFQLGKEHYALGASQVVEVLPLVELKQILRAPSGVAGLFTYHGQPVPVIDLSALALGRPAEMRLSTRIMVVNYKGPAQDQHLLGLIVERTGEIINRQRSDFVSGGVAVKAAPYLGPVTLDTRGLIQLVEVDQLLTESLRQELFCQPVEPA